jgi:hypothetical protein
MNRREHLTENQLNAYFGDSALAQEAKHEIGRHLLQCDFCLKRLPQPTAEHFWAALMTDENADDFVDERDSLADRLRLNVQKLMQPKIFAWGAGALAIVLVFTATIWFNAAKSADGERELAQNLEIGDRQSLPSQVDDNKINLPQSFPPVERNNNRSPESSNRTTANRDPLDTKDIEPKEKSKTAPQSVFNGKIPPKQSNDEKGNISLTRGGSSQPCGDQKSINLAMEMSDEAVVLKWRKIPEAAKYHLYVSDDEEILLDEYETTQETTYVLKKALDPQKTYKWKVVVTLANGNTIIGDSQKFTVKDFQQNLKKSEKKKKSDVRCSENN